MAANNRKLEPGQCRRISLQAAVRQPEPIFSHKCLADATSGVGCSGMVSSSPCGLLPLRHIPVSAPYYEIKKHPM
jgi:hypothetical protein